MRRKWGRRIDGDGLGEGNGGGEMEGGGNNGVGLHVCMRSDGGADWGASEFRFIDAVSSPISCMSGAGHVCVSNPT